MGEGEKPRTEPASKRVKNLPNCESMEVSPLETLGCGGLIKKYEFVRVIIQALSSLGYQKTAALLEEESGILHQSPEYQMLQSQILDANWDASIETLNGIQDLVAETRDVASLLIFEQMFIECLNEGDDSKALWVLRERICPLGISQDRVHGLAYLIVSWSIDKEFKWFKKGDEVGTWRRNLLIQLEKLVPPPIMLPPRRLEHLVEMALAEQRNSCFYHNSTDDAISLYWDHSCGPDQIPTETLQILEKHQNEVWFVQFSNNGQYLASSSRDCTAIIWMVSEEGTVSLKHTLESHQKPVSVVAWSPDDTMLLTCGNGEVLKLWDVETGTCKRTFEGGGLGVSSCAWFPDSRQIVCGSYDNCIYTWDLEGKELAVWRGPRMPKISDLSVTSDGVHLVCVCAEKVIQVHNFLTKDECIITEDQAITSLSVSRDGKLLICNLNSQEIHMWDVAGTWDEPFRYQGHRQGQYVIRSCFGGSDSDFIASGSEDSQVYIWHRQSRHLLAILPGHSSTVNCVSWNPVKTYMLASASDDHTIRIWGSSRSRPKDCDK